MNEIPNSLFGWLTGWRLPLDTGRRSAGEEWKDTTGRLGSSTLLLRDSVLDSAMKIELSPNFLLWESSRWTCGRTPP